MPMNVGLKSEVISLEVTELRSAPSDETDKNVTEASYTEKYSLTVTPTAWMKKYGKRAALVVQYKFSAVVASTFAVQTKVGGADIVETTGITVTTEKTHVHSDIVSFASPLTVSLEAKRTAGTDTGVLDYFHVYLQIGTKSTSPLEVARITGVKAFLNFQSTMIKVFTGATDTASLEVGIDFSQAGEARWTLTGSLSYKTEGLVSESTVVKDFICFLMMTSNASNPALLNLCHYRRVWFG